MNCKISRLDEIEDSDDIYEEIWGLKYNINNQSITDGASTDRWGQALDFDIEKFTNGIVQICSKHGYEISKDNAESVTMEMLG